jgi:Icc-related predicted phosphoesterase
MKILPISDIHNDFSIFKYITTKITQDYDVLTISGDIFEGRNTKPLEFIQVIEDLQKQIQKPIVMIQGNHDYWNHTIFDDSKDIHVLHNSGIEIDGVKFWGSPYTPRFFNWNFMLDDRSTGMDEIFINDMPSDVDVLLSHGPPFGLCDKVRDRGEPLGSVSLLDGLYTNKPRYVFCGHIHTGDRHDILSIYNYDIHIYNVSCLDEQYFFTQIPTVVEID